MLRLESCAAARVLGRHGMSLQAVRDEVGEIVRERDVRKGKRELAALGEFARDLTDFAATGGFDPLVGRKEEVDRIVQILLRRTKNNPTGRPVSFQIGAAKPSSSVAVFMSKPRAILP